MSTAMSVTARPVWDTRLEPRDYYCPACDTFLFASSATDGSTRVYCRRCKAWQVLDHEPPNIVKGARR